jgi:hypothetical protein
MDAEELKPSYQRIEPCRMALHAEARSTRTHRDVEVVLRDVDPTMIFSVALRLPGSQGFTFSAAPVP